MFNHRFGFNRTISPTQQHRDSQSMDTISICAPPEGEHGPTQQDTQSQILLALHILIDVSNVFDQHMEHL